MSIQHSDCPYCKAATRAKKQVRLRRHRYNKAFAIELEEARQSGKVVMLWERDEFTGHHYRINKHGQYVAGGLGRSIYA